MTQAFIIAELDDTQLVSSTVLYDAYISYTGKYLNMYYNSIDKAIEIATKGTFSNFEKGGGVRQRDGEDECIYGDSIDAVTPDIYDYIYYYSKRNDAWMVKLPNDENVWFILSDMIDCMIDNEHEHEHEHGG